MLPCMDSEVAERDWIKRGRPYCDHPAEGVRTERGMYGATGDVFCLHCGAAWMVRTPTPDPRGVRS